MAQFSMEIMRLTGSLLRGNQQSRFISEIHEDFMERLEAGELDSEEKREIMLDIYREELLERFPEWENLQMSVVAGAGFEPAAFRL